MQCGGDEFVGALFRFHDAQIGNDRHRAFARKAQLLAVIATLTEADRGDEAQPVDEGMQAIGRLLIPPPVFATTSPLMSPP